MPALNKSDYLAVLQKLLPTGTAWARTPSSVITMLLGSFARLSSSFDLRLQVMLLELNPATTDLLLTEWEQFVETCDSCCAEDGTQASRRTRVITKLTEQGSLTKAYFLQLAADLGYVDTTITEFGPTHCEMTCEAAVRSIDWRFLWEVNLPHQGYISPVTEFLPPTNCETDCAARLFETPWPSTRYFETENHTSFRVGSRCDARVDSYAFGALECQFMRLKPAHTHVIFTYRGLTT